MKKEEIWKLVASGLGSTLLTIIVMWFTLVRSFITEEQASVLIQTRTPYIQDRQVLLKNVDVTEQLVTDVNAATKELAVTQRSIIAKLDSIILFVTGIQDRVSTLETRILYLERSNTDNPE